MTHSHLNAAVRAARYLASMVASIRGLMDAGASKEAARLVHELHDNLDAAEDAIRAVAKELRPVGDAHVRFGDIVAPTAHEAAIELVHALNRSRLGVEIISHREVKAWPFVDELLAEIELEHRRAVGHRQQLKPAADGDGSEHDPPDKYDQHTRPAEFRENGDSRGAMLVSTYLEGNREKWGLTKSEISTAYNNPNGKLTRRVKVRNPNGGKFLFAYLYKELCALRLDKTDRQPD